MTKVIYNGKEIELIDELEDGYMELDILTNDEENIKLENDGDINLEDTIELKPINLEDTQEFKIGDIYE